MGGKTVKQTALKLHRQFGHPSSERLIKMLQNAGVKNMKLEKSIHDVRDNCDVCIKFSKAPPKPIVSIPLADSFNEVLAMDLKVFGNKYFLVMVDVHTKYCAASVINDKKPKTIVENLFSSWIAIFGPPRKIYSDNGGEFNNSVMSELGETFNIKLMTTPAQSPWANGIVERLNSVIGRSVSKVICETNCDVKIALAWAISARNALCTYTGYSPNQLVFGFNPAIPSYATNHLPALGKLCDADIVRNNLNAMHAARQEFVRIESDKKLQKAIASNVRETKSIDIQCGEEVYYKRNECNEWKGPAKVIGRDGKTILVKHGGMIVRVHTCRIARNPSSLKNITSDVTKNANISPSSSSAIYNPKQATECVDCHDKVEIMDDDVWYETQSDHDQLSSNVIIPPEVINEENRPPNTAVSSVNAQVKGRALKKGQRIRATLGETGEVITGTVAGRAGKATGAYSSWYNIENNDDKSVKAYDMNRDFDSLEVIEDEQELLILYNSEMVHQAKEIELEKWENNEVFSEVPDEGQDRISVRWIITEKLKNGNPEVKARLVARGFEEETSFLKKDSPTCSKGSIRTTLSIAASKGWQCNSLDIKSAFLQGGKIDRDVYLVPPPEFDNGTLWKLHKTVYGLCDAARAWYLKVKEQLLRHGFSMSKFDDGLFSLTRNGKLEGLVCIHVDDFLYCGTEFFNEYVYEKISMQFNIGSSSLGAIKYVGLNIVSSSDGKCTIDQNQYSSILQPVIISKARMNNSKSELTIKEKAEFRAAVGQLNWIATQTRPEIAFEACFLAGCYKNATVADIVRLNKLIERVKRAPVKIKFPPISDLSSCRLMCYADASWANLSDGGSQGAMLLTLEDGNGNICPLHWQTKKIRRIVKSTLAAETLALLDCAEEALHMANLIKDVLNVDKIDIVCKVDNKSLVEALYSNKQVEGKRLRVEVNILKEMINRKEILQVKWIPTNLQLANCLTKGGASAKSLLQAIGE